MMAASYLLLPQPVPQTSKAVLALGWYSSSAQVTLSTVWGRRGWHTSAPQHILLSCMQVLNTILSCLLSTCPWETDFSFCITVVFETMAQLCIFVLKIFLRKIRLQWTRAIRSSTSKRCPILLTSQMSHYYHNQVRVTRAASIQKIQNLQKLSKKVWQHKVYKYR